jgi:hypothetical protein
VTLQATSSVGRDAVVALWESPDSLVAVARFKPESIKLERLPCRIVDDRTVELVLTTTSSETAMNALSVLIIAMSSELETQGHAVKRVVPVSSRRL